MLRASLNEARFLSDGAERTAVCVIHMVHSGVQLSHSGGVPNGTKFACALRACLIKGRDRRAPCVDSYGLP